jgi:hypothetical protein
MHIFIHNTGDPIQGPSGLPAADCVIVATLTDTATGLETSVWDTIDNDLIASTEVIASCDSNGEIILENGLSTLKLWPNDRGDKPTHYIIKAPLGEFNTFNAIVLSSPATQTLIQIAAQVTPLTTQELSALATHASSPVHNLNTTVLNKITEVNSLPIWNGDLWPGGGGGGGGVTDHNYLTNKGTNTHSQIDTALTRLATTSGTNTGDQVIPITLPASDVSAWAKASTKPVYTASEVGAEVSGAAAAITLSGLGGVSTSDSRLHAIGSDNQDLSGLMPKNLATAVDMSLVSSGIGTWIAKTLSEFKTWLGLGSAAYTASADYATADQGTDARPASDVSAWAKAGTKPTYNYTEVGADAAGAAAAITLSGLGGITSSSAVAPNTAITPGTKTKITYDAKGLVTAGADATAADVGAAATGAIGSSGLTMTTEKILGRSTASTGAVEELDFSFVAGINWRAGEISITSTATATLGRMHVCSGTTSDYTITLPAVSGNAGKFAAFRIATACTKLITLDGNSTELIDGLATRIMWAGENCLLYCDGTQWTKLAGRSIPMSCKMHIAGAQNFSSGVSTKIKLDTIDYAYPAIFANNSTNNWKAIAPRASNYFVLFIASTNGNNASNCTWANIVGFNASVYLSQNTDISANKIATASFSIIYSVGTNESIEGYINYSAGSFTTSVIYATNGAILSITEIPAW